MVVSRYDDVTIHRYTKGGTGLYPVRGLSAM